MKHVKENSGKNFIDVDGSTVTTGKYNNASYKPNKTTKTSTKYSGTEHQPVRTCFRMSVNSKKWETLPELTIPRHNHNVVVTKEQWIYVIGGSKIGVNSRDKVLRDCERFPTMFYDAKQNSNKWLTFPRMIKTRANTASCYHNQRIYTVGGFCPETNEVLDICEIYDIAKSCWIESDASLRIPRCSATLTSVSGKMYLVGGAWIDPKIEEKSGLSEFNFVSLRDIDVYDEVSRCWEVLTAMEEPRHLHSSCLISENRLYIVGGQQCKVDQVDNEIELNDTAIVKNECFIKTLDSVECLDLERNCWISGVQKLPLKIVGAQCVPLKSMKVYYQ